jgi:hypothetical protein
MDNKYSSVYECFLFFLAFLGHLVRTYIYKHAHARTHTHTLKCGVSHVPTGICTRKYTRIHIKI